MKKVDNIVTRLPLLDYLDTSYLINDEQPFTGYKVFAVQHLLGSTVPLFAMFERGGVNPEDITIVGKAYSSHPKVVKDLAKRGYSIRDDIFDFVEDQPYDEMLEKHITSAFESLLATTNFEDGNTKVLLVDDGGKAIKMLNTKYERFAQYFTCVEQTSRGAHLLSTIDLHVPVINVARSEAKTLYESPLIADSMVQEFLESLKNWKEVFKLKNNNVLLLGYGYIGERVCKRLQKYGFNITIYDQANDKLIQAENDGFKTINDRVKEYPNVGLIIGCSGAPSIPLDEFSQIKPGTLLVNMASTDLEFSAWNFRKVSSIVYKTILPDDAEVMKDKVSLPWRSLYKITHEHTLFYLANGGFPIDFSGNIDPIDPNKIQLTRALLFGAAIQAIRTKSNRLVNLDSTIQADIVSEYARLQKCV